MTPADKTDLSLSPENLYLAAQIHDAIMDHPGLDPIAKKRVIQQLKKFRDGDTPTINKAFIDWMQDLDPDDRSLEREVMAVDAALANVDRDNACRGELLDWMKAGLRLERPVGSAIHKLHEAVNDGKALFAPGIRNDVAGYPLKDFFGETQTFVVEHDWHGAFKNATDYTAGEWNPPYEKCSFEFRMSGKRVIANFSNSFSMHGEKYDLGCMIFVETSHGWALPDFIFKVDTGGDGNWAALVGTQFFKANGNSTPGSEPLVQVISHQVRAICIALDAEAAVTDTVRAPHKLNRAREKRGRLPLYDYHVVKLNRRERGTPLPLDQQTHGERNSPRLHLVRGHFRHYPNHKTWIKWFFRGNPDLGFIDKEYRL
jgi:hypothetical protein